MDALRPIVLAVALYMVPVWYCTETLAWYLEARGVRKATWAQIVLRAFPPVVALALVLLSPRTLAAVLSEAESAAFPELVLFALVTGAAAVQLHQWRIPQTIGAALRSTIRRLGGKE